jgi:glycerol 2-dehydrogenase (NADP+)
LSVVGLTAVSGNEQEVGQGIKDSGVPRKDIFITSKLWNTHQQNVEEGLKRSLDALETDYLDLYVSYYCNIERRLGLTIILSSFTGLCDWSR